MIRSNLSPRRQIRVMPCSIHKYFLNGMVSLFNAKYTIYCMVVVCCHFLFNAQYVVLAWWSFAVIHCAMHKMHFIVYGGRLAPFLVKITICISWHGGIFGVIPYPMHQFLASVIPVDILHIKAVSIQSRDSFSISSIRFGGRYASNTQK